MSRSLGTWDEVLRELLGLCGSKHFLQGLMFYVGHDFYESSVGQNILRGSANLQRSKLRVGANYFFARLQKFLRGLIFLFAWVNFSFEFKNVLVPLFYFVLDLINCD